MPFTTERSLGLMQFELAIISETICVTTNDWSFWDPGRNFDEQSGGNETLITISPSFGDSVFGFTSC